MDDAKAIEKLAPSIDIVDVMLGTGITQTTERLYYRGDRTSQQAIVGATEEFAIGQLRAAEPRPLLHRARGRCTAGAWW